MSETANPEQWSEDNSAVFIELGEVMAPARREQIATLLALIPAQRDEAFTVVEMAAGEGLLARAVLEQFPACHYVALDISPAMRERMAHTLAPFSDRLTIQHFALEEQAWRDTLPTPLRCVLCSLSVHHLNGAGKQQLFADIVSHLEPGGALLLADIVEPATPHIAQLYARQYDEIVRQQSLVARGNLSVYEQFQQLEWNYFASDYGTAQTFDQPSLLSDQLLWLREAGFSLVDCFWLRAGHAVFGGYK